MGYEMTTDAGQPVTAKELVAGRRKHKQPASQLGSATLAGAIEVIGVDQMRQALLERGAKDYVDGLCKMLAYRNNRGMPNSRYRWAFQLYARAIKLVGGEGEVLQKLLLATGLTSEMELRKLVERHQALGSYSLEDAERDGVEALRLVLRERPERGAEIRRRLFGEHEVNGEGS